MCSPVNLHIDTSVFPRLTLFCLYLEKNNYLLQWQRTDKKRETEEKASWLRELHWLVLPSKRSTTTPLAMVMILDLLNHCLHSIKRVELMHSFKVRQKMNVKDAAQEAGSIAGFNEKTVR